jgi:type I restriction-modification system DNA methylase subunit
MIHHLAENGTMAIVLPHGALFRSGAEQHIRKYLIEDRNYLDAVIGLPANYFMERQFLLVLWFSKSVKKIQTMFCLSMQPSILKEELKTHCDKKILTELLQLTEKERKLKNTAVWQRLILLPKTNTI